MKVSEEQLKKLKSIISRREGTKAKATIEAAIKLTFEVYATLYQEEVAWWEEVEKEFGALNEKHKINLKTGEIEIKEVKQGESDSTVRTGPEAVKPDLRIEEGTKEHSG